MDKNKAVLITLGALLAIALLTLTSCATHNFSRYTMSTAPPFPSKVAGQPTTIREAMQSGIRVTLGDVYRGVPQCTTEQLYSLRFQCAAVIADTSASAAQRDQARGIKAVVEGELAKRGA